MSKTTTAIILGALLLWWLLPRRVKASITVPDSVGVKVPTQPPQVGAADDGIDPGFVDSLPALPPETYDPDYVDSLPQITPNPLEPPRFVDSASIF